MSQSKPFHRNYRGFKEGPNSGFSQWAYIVDRAYAASPEHYVRAFLLIQNDLQKLFEYVEPSDVNLDTFSYRIHELFMRTCIEVEANFRAILNENIYTPISRSGDPIPDSRWNIHNYRIVDHTHHLSSYRVHLPIWEVRVPLALLINGKRQTNCFGTKPITKANTIEKFNLDRRT